LTPKTKINLVENRYFRFFLVFLLFFPVILKTIGNLKKLHSECTNIDSLPDKKKILLKKTVVLFQLLIVYTDTKKFLKFLKNTRHRKLNTAKSSLRSQSRIRFLN